MKAEANAQKVRKGRRKPDGGGAVGGGDGDGGHEVDNDNHDGNKKVCSILHISDPNLTF